MLLLLRVPEACSAALASAVALRLSDHLSAALVLRSRASALAAAAAALVLAAAAAAAALALPLIYSHFFPNLVPLPNAAIAAAAIAAAAAAASSAAEGLLYGQGRVAIINASGLFANWVRYRVYHGHNTFTLIIMTSIIAIVITTTTTTTTPVTTTMTTLTGGSSATGSVAAPRTVPPAPRLCVRRVGFWSYSSHRKSCHGV